MVLYECPRCFYSTTTKSCFKDHLNKKTNCKIVPEGLDVNTKYIFYILNNPQSIKQQVETSIELVKLKKENAELKYKANSNNIHGDYNTLIDNSININVVLQLDNTNIHRVVDMKGIKDFKDLVTVLHSFSENRNIYKPNLNKDKRVRALMKNGWNTFNSVEDIPKYLEMLKDVIDMSTRPDEDKTIGMEDEDMLKQINMGLYDIKKKYNMNK